MSAPPRPRLWRFGAFELDAEAGELRRQGRLVPLPPQCVAVLECLVARPRHVVAREELRARLWPAGVHVDQERGLNHCLNRIRLALGDDARAPRFVETLRGRGYRFLADVEAVAAPAPVQSTRPWLATLAAALLLALPASDDAPRPQPTIDPEAQVALAEHYLRLAETRKLAAASAYPAARRAARAALAVSEQARPLALLATLDLNYGWDWAGAERSYRAALRLDPDLLDASLGYARLLSAAGRHDEAQRVLDEASRRLPGCPLIAREAAFASYRARHFARAREWFETWAALEPELRDPHHWLALLLRRDGDNAGAVREVRRVLELAHADARFVARFEALPPAAALEFYLRGCLRYLEDLGERRWVTRDDLAPLHAALGESGNVLADLEQAADERSPRLLPYLNDPAFDAVRKDARFEALRRRVRLPAPA